MAFSDSGGGGWGSADDGPTAANNALASLREACSADDVRLLVCYSTNDGEEYMPAPANKLAKAAKYVAKQLAEDVAKGLLQRLIG